MLKIEMSVEEAMVLKALVVEAKKEFSLNQTHEYRSTNPTQYRRMLAADFSLSDQSRLNEVSHKISDALRERMKHG